MNAPERLQPGTVAAPALAPALRDAAVHAQRASVVCPAADVPVRALHEVDLSIARGDSVALIGPSGCGKPLLVLAIADLAPISAGSVSVNGMSPHDARLARADGCVFQPPVLFPWRTVLANVMLPPQIPGLSREACESVAREQLHGPGRFRTQMPLAAVRRHAAARVARAGARHRAAPPDDGARDHQRGADHVVRRLPRGCGLVP